MSDQTNDNSDDENKPMKIVFAEGCFDDFEGTQEELDELVAHIQSLAESGELLEKSVPIDLGDVESAGMVELELAALVEQTKEVQETYGFDDNGYVKYPFAGNTRH